MPTTIKISRRQHRIVVQATPEKKISLTRPSRTFKVQHVGRRGPPGADADKHFEQPFTNLAVVEVNHNLGKKPAVVVMNSAGDEVIGDVNHIDDDNLTVTFSSSFSGVVACN